VIKFSGRSVQKFLSEIANRQTDKQEIDHRLKASRNLGQGQMSYSETGCGIFKTRWSSGKLKQKCECVPDRDSGWDPRSDKDRIRVSSEI